MRISTGYALALATALTLPAVAQTGATGYYAKSLAPYVTSPQTVVDRMLELAQVKPGEVVYDLGCGDGRVLITAVRNFHAKAVGVELNGDIARKAEQKIAKMGLQTQARVVVGDMRDMDLTPADVVTLYLMTDSNAVLRPKLEKSLKPGARVVSHDFRVPGWKADKVDLQDPFGQGHKHTIYLYIMPPQTSSN